MAKRKKSTAKRIPKKRSTISIVKKKSSKKTPKKKLPSKKSKKSSKAVSYARSGDRSGSAKRRDSGNATKSGNRDSNDSGRKSGSRRSAAKDGNGNAKDSSRVRKQSPKKSKRAAPRATIVPVSPTTGKVITRPKKGQEVYFAIQIGKKVTKLETPFSQKYTKADAKALQTSLRSASPDAFLVHQQLTRTPVRLPDGSFDYHTINGQVQWEKNKAGKEVPAKKYKYKLTGRKLRQKQRTVIVGVKGYLHATGVGFTPKTKQESAKGVTLIAVGKRKVSADIALKGDTIKDTVKNLRPAIGTRDMIKRGIQKLGVHGTVRISKPKNPYKKGSAEHASRESWINNIWGAGAGVLTVNFSRIIDRLANFSDSLATAIREALSKQGLRLTSLFRLGQIEYDVRKEDAKERKAGRKFSPKAHTIIERPFIGSKKGADEFLPLRPENDNDYPIHKNSSPYNAGVILNLTVEPLK